MPDFSVVMGYKAICGDMFANLPQNCNDAANMLSPRGVRGNISIDIVGDSRLSLAELDELARRFAILARGQHIKDQ